MPDISSSSSFLNQVQVPQTSNPAISTAAAPATGTQSLGKDDFLKLLIAQLQNQDPSKPMDDSQTIAQMAQFSALEAMQNLNQTMQQNNNVQSVFQAGALIGKYVQADQQDGSSITGTVTGVDFTTTNGAMLPTLQVNGADVDYGTIVKVSAAPLGSTASSATTGTSGTTGTTSATTAVTTGTTATGSSTSSPAAPSSTGTASTTTATASGTAGN